MCFSVGIKRKFHSVSQKFLERGIFMKQKYTKKQYREALAMLQSFTQDGMKQADLCGITGEERLEHVNQFIKALAPQEMFDIINHFQS